MSIAVYAGSFDPVTAGHLSIVLQAVRLFTHLVVLVANNPNKRTLFTVDEREKMLRNAVRLHPNVTVSSTDGFVVEYARKIGATFLVRGIRSATDAVFETSLAQQNRELAPEIATILLPAVATLSEVSSSQLKDLVRRGESTDSFCPPEVAAALRQRIAEEDLRTASSSSNDPGSAS